MIISCVIGVIFASVMIYAGVFSSKFPVEWEEQDSVWLRPGYLAGKAKESQEIWNQAQKLYGKYSTIMGLLQLLLTIPESRLFLWVSDRLWQKEDDTIPFLAIVILPAFLLIGLSYLLTRIELRKKFMGKKRC